MRPRVEPRYAAQGWDKAGFVQALFARIAGRYDLMNGLMSLGMVRSWRRAAVRAMGLGQDGLVLDVGSGTGGLARQVARGAPGVRVIGLDFSEEMVKLGRDRLARTELDGRVQMAVGDALALPFPEGSFDRVSSAFLLRNVADLRGTLSEMHRVVHPGGTIVALDLARPQNRLLGFFFDIYVGYIVPFIGALITGARWAYEYLLPSLDYFPPPQEVERLLREVGFGKVRTRRIFPGVAVLYVAAK